jgi:hypothetical protein
MVIIEAIFIAVVIRGLIKIFMTNSGSYSSK